MKPLVGVWQRLPTLVRAVLVGSFVGSVGTLPWSVLAKVNFELAPAIPWSVPVMAIVLWGYWQYWGGRGWPRTTAEWRRMSLRARPLSGPAWRWSLLAGGLAWASLLALRIFSDTFFQLPGDFPEVSAYPFVTVLCYVLMASVVAGLTEEAGFRGYMQGPLERRYGPRVAILTVGIVFGLAHYTHFIGHGWLFLAYLPYYLTAALIFGALAYLSGSILAGVVLHAGANVLGFGLLWWWTASPSTFLGVGDRRGLLLWVTCSAGIVLAVPAIWAYRRLTGVVRQAVSVALGASTCFWLASCAARETPRPPANTVLPAMIQEMFDALPADAGVWERHLADDALFVGEEGRVYTKAELLKEFGPFPEGLKGSIKVRDPRIVEHGDLAVVTFDLVEDEQVFDQAIRVLYFGSQAWRFQEGRWRLVLAQSGVRAQDPAPVPAAGVRLADYDGTYVVGPWRYKVEARGSELWAGREGRDAKRLIAVGDNVFVEPGDPLSILRVFARGPDGGVDRMIERRKFADLVWNRQRE